MWSHLLHEPQLSTSALLVNARSSRTFLRNSMDLLGQSARLDLCVCPQFSVARRQRSSLTKGLRRIPKKWLTVPQIRSGNDSGFCSSWHCSKPLLLLNFATASFRLYTWPHPNGHRSPQFIPQSSTQSRLFNRHRGTDVKRKEWPTIANGSGYSSDSW